MAYREKGRGTNSTAVNDKHHGSNNGRNIPETKRDRYRLRELAEGIKEVAMNIDHIDSAALRDLDQAIKLLGICRAKPHSDTVYEPTKPPANNAAKTLPLNSSINQLESEIDQLRAELQTLSTSAQSFHKENGTRLTELEKKYCSDSIQASQLYSRMHRFFSQLNRTVCSPQLFHQILSDIELLYESVSHTLESRKRMSESLDRYKHETERIDMSSEQDE